MPHDDYDALIFLYDALKGTKWTNSTNWDDPDVPMSKWHGIKINMCGRVEEICLNDNKLVGELPDSDRWCALSNHVKRLYLANNFLVKSIPKSIGTLTKLEELNLSWNKLTGSIPEEIFELKSLKVIRLDNNRLSGSISENIIKLTALEFLDCSRNLLSGLIPYCLIQHMKEEHKPDRRLYAEIEDANIDKQYAVVYQEYQERLAEQKFEIEALQAEAARLEELKDNNLDEEDDEDEEEGKEEIEESRKIVEFSTRSDTSSSGSGSSYSSSGSETESEEETELEYEEVNIVVLQPPPRDMPATILLPNLRVVDLSRNKLTLK